MNKAEEEYIKSLSHSNDRRFVLLKAAEELSELSIESSKLATTLIQAVTKPQTLNVNNLSNEIADVQIQLVAVRELFGIFEKKISELETEKIAKLIMYKGILKEQFGQI